MKDSSDFKMDKTVFSVVPLSQADDEKEYWLSKTPQERLEALEFIRQAMYGYDPDTTRLQRVFLKLLNANKVQYLLIGGYAVGYYGYIRATGDMDIWVAPNAQNASRTVTVLREFGFDVPELSEELLKPDNVLRMGVPPVRLEVLSSISGVSFDECYSDRVVDVIDDVQVPIISLHHLKSNKKASGRLKDLIDLEHLP